MYLLASLHNVDYLKTSEQTLRERIDSLKMPFIGIPINSEIQMVRTLPMVTIIKEKYEDVILLKIEPDDDVKKVGVLEIAKLQEDLAKNKIFNLLTDTYEDEEATIEKFNELKEAKGLEEDMCVYIVPAEIAKKRTIAAINIYDIFEYIKSGINFEMANKMKELDVKNELTMDKGNKIIKDKLKKDFNPLDNINETINNISKFIDCYDKINIKKILNGKTPMNIHVDKIRCIWEQLNKEITESLISTSDEELIIEINIKTILILKLTISMAMGPLFLALLENTKIKADSAFIIIDILKQRNLLDNLKYAKKYEIIKSIQNDLSDSAITNAKQRKEIRRYNKK